jgi:MEMO1 family protein
MHLPYIKKLFEGQDIKLVPLMVGHVPEDKFEAYGKILSKYLSDSETLFIVSTDFCHWGKRFKFTYQNKDFEFIHQSIEYLDKEGIKLLESHDLNGFSKYLKNFGNTICGRLPL